MSKKLTAKQRRMKKAVESLQEYMNTYSNQTGYLDYSDETFINDVLYGIGIALEPEDHQFAQGFRKFLKEKLKKLVDTEVSRYVERKPTEA